MKSKLFYISLIVIFCSFAFLQFNDPDPEIWSSAYFLVALFSGFSIFTSSLKLRMAIKLTILSYSLWAISFTPAIYEWINAGLPSITPEMDYRNTYIELMREFFGLIISLLALFSLLVVMKRSVRSDLTES